MMDSMTAIAANAMLAAETQGTDSVHADFKVLVEHSNLPLADDEEQQASGLYWILYCVLPWYIHLIDVVCSVDGITRLIITVAVCPHVSHTSLLYLRARALSLSLNFVMLT